MFQAQVRAHFRGQGDPPHPVHMAEDGLRRSAGHHPPPPQLLHGQRAEILPDLENWPAQGGRQIHLGPARPCQTVGAALIADQLRGLDQRRLRPVVPGQPPELRFVGLDNVSAVYVVANSAEETLAKGAVLKTDFTTTLDKQGPAVEQNQVIFAGSDVDITPVQEEIIAGVPTYDGTPEAGDQVYTAEVKIRPILSRMEWGKIEIQESGLVERTIGDKKYMVEWSGWNPTISGIFQSNAYLTDNVFAPSVDDLFATPTNTNALVNGAWTAMTGYETTWTAYNAALAYTGYAEGTGYAAVLPVGYDGTASCVPFHFFVPFDTTSDAAEVEGSLTATPGWHFQLYYPEQTGYTVKVYNYDADTADHKGTEVDVNVDNDALAVMGDFMFPVREDHLAYANVYSLNEADAQVAYKPGKIYNANISIAPYNVTSGFKDVTDYNVIVKVSVADFDKVAVTPNFDKN